MTYNFVTIALPLTKFSFIS